MGHYSTLLTEIKYVDKVGLFKYIGKIENLSEENRAHWVSNFIDNFDWEETKKEDYLVCNDPYSKWYDVDIWLCNLAEYLNPRQEILFADDDGNYGFYIDGYYHVHPIVYRAVIEDSTLDEAKSIYKPAEECKKYGGAECV